MQYKKLFGAKELVFRVILAISVVNRMFSEDLLQWYSVNKRDLPWRKTRDPYLIWLSEIIMQQTRINQGLPYWERMVKAFPTVYDMAVAGEQEVLRLWQGLGYYSRARNMHATARHIVSEYGGKFPQNYSGIRSLKGIGDYTAAAVASIAFGLPYPVVDGNVLRFFARLFGIEEAIDLPKVRREIGAHALRLIDRGNPGDFNQAVMEFGARVCTPQNPGCDSCFLKSECVAFMKQIAGRLPVRSVKPAVQDRYLHYLVITFGQGAEAGLFLNYRTGRDIWQNMYDFPQPETVSNPRQRAKEQELRLWFNGMDPEFMGVSGHTVHKLTHQTLHVWFYRFHFDTPPPLPLEAVLISELERYPLPRPIDRYLKENL